MERKLPGVLYLCATPIGNLEDITLRALRVLKEADCIAAEDTRHTRKLLSHYEIHTPLVSYHSHSSQSKADHLIQRLLQGENIALVADAGTPGISDPGAELVCQALQHDIAVVPVPGPVAAIAALTAAGLPTHKFVFEGFLSNQPKTRRKQLQALQGEQRTMVFYESPHRLADTLRDMLAIWGDRPCAVARELTKLHEEFKRGTLARLADYYRQNPPRGEITLIVGGLPPAEAAARQQETWAELSLAEHVASLVDQGIAQKEAIKQVARLRGLAKREVYAAVHGDEGRKG
ncbi:16S rRNA (cytidine(1402)-2'-O)-methyltransferase [Desulforamulus hydrothermalis]|uniref:Ribosomal RNA small subunit methyltransferase I n=1 Tax=Desulforamulus hydrothermalis Lam5 = DSM 18033 TaxID=1121428 RepID=K8DZT3_9FIRM|nr:16S rRNA (cytidine(1402)-2'-O)-methyltransferase [Desulforamulus hydrothermalis]CCO08565.1 putative methyltransferase [Desulforamulus hydrothermalis Lam5 = DSM 18033]SHH02089.1 16S rRNA (cytidine1402-2'-O)-methyltransferase [Desulforamulus hydrothermalis Lam5 = DSM 18033]